jgi:quercetin dioxygenase-like cupin family protein
MHRALTAAIAFLALAASFPTTLVAQQPAPPAATQAAPGIKRTILQRADVPGTNLETIVALVEVAANFKAGRHTHPGQAIGYVQEGEFFMTFDGQPEKTLKPGDSLVVPKGTVHDEGTKDKSARIIAVYVLEKGQPIATPVK